MHSSTTRTSCRRTLEPPGALKSHGGFPTIRTNNMTSADITYEGVRGAAEQGMRQVRLVQAGEAFAADGSLTLGLVLHEQPGPPFGIKKINRRGALAEVWPKLTPGMQLISFDGQDVTSLKFAELAKLIRATIKRPVTLGFVSDTVPQDSHAPDGGGQQTALVFNVDPAPVAAHRDYDPHPDAAEFLRQNSSRSVSWGHLSTAEQSAAASMGFDAANWAREPAAEADVDDVDRGAASQLLPTADAQTPTFSLPWDLPWLELSTSQRKMAEDLGYDQDAWSDDDGDVFNEMFEEEASENAEQHSPDIVGPGSEPEVEAGDIISPLAVVLSQGQQLHQAVRVPAGAPPRKRRPTRHHRGITAGDKHQAGLIDEMREHLAKTASALSAEEIDELIASTFTGTIGVHGANSRKTRPVQPLPTVTSGMPMEMGQTESEPESVSREYTHGILQGVNLENQRDGLDRTVSIRQEDSTLGTMTCEEFAEFVQSQGSADLTDLARHLLEKKVDGKLVFSHICRQMHSRSHVCENQLQAMQEFLARFGVVAGTAAAAALHS